MVLLPIFLINGSALRIAEAQHPHDAIRDAPAVDTGAARIVQQRRFDHAALAVGQVVAVHRQVYAIREFGYKVRPTASSPFLSSGDPFRYPPAYMPYALFQ